MALIIWSNINGTNYNLTLSVPRVSGIDPIAILT